MDCETLGLMAPAPRIGNPSYRAIGAACLALTLISCSVVSPHSSKSEGLLAAAEKGDSRKVKALLDDGVPVDCRDIISIQAIHKAAKSGDLELVRLLLMRGARIDARDHSGEQPIHYAAASGNVELIKFLLDSGVRVDARSDYGRQPLHLAAGWGRLDAARFLLERGARVNALADAIYGTPLHEADGHAEMVSFLLAHGAKVNATREDGKTPLHNTAEFGHIDSAKILLDHGARIEASIDKDIYGFESGGERPIHIAARRDRPEYIEFLLDQGAWIDAPDARGNTPLDKAVRCGGDGDEAVSRARQPPGCQSSAGCRIPDRCPRSRGAATDPRRRRMGQAGCGPFSDIPRGGPQCPGCTGSFAVGSATLPSFESVASG